ncbi:MAG: ABC transporter substrate-binding protein, partial [Dehalococcoidia bacterium]
MRTEDNYWVRRRRLSRRGFIRGSAIVGAGAAGLALVGCGDDDDDGGTTASPTATSAGSSPAASSPTPVPATPTPEGPRPGGVLRHSSANATYDTFDAARSRFTPFATILGRTGQRITQWDDFQEGIMGGGFAESWEQPDAQTINLKLRPNNFWQDKPPVNGRQTVVEDMQFHIERAKAGVLQDGTPDPNFYRNGDYQIVDSTSVVDENTLQVKLTKPSPLFLNLLAQSYEVVQAPEAVKKFEKDYSNFDVGMIIGTGPYILTEFDPEGRLKYRKFDKFYGTTYLDGVAEVPLFTDQAALQAAFEQKQVDVFSPSTIAQLDDLRSRYEGQIVDSPGFSANPIVGFQGFGGAPPP